MPWPVRSLSDFADDVQHATEVRSLSAGVGRSVATPETFKGANKNCTNVVKDVLTFRFAGF